MNDIFSKAPSSQIPATCKSQHCGVACSTDQHVFALVELFHMVFLEDICISGARWRHSRQHNATLFESFKLPQLSGG